MKVLVTGGSSTPGFRIVEEFAKAGYKVVAQYNEHEIPAIDNIVKVKAYFRNVERVVELVNEAKPDIVIHTAAIGDVDKCEIDKELAWRVNVEATLALVKSVSKLNSYFLYLSTDYVFDGERGLYKEDDVPNPVNYYGFTKLVAENIVRSGQGGTRSLGQAISTGSGWVVRICQTVVEALSQGQKVKALVDQWLSPTLNTLLAKAVRELVEMDYIGVVHIAGERISRYEFAKAIAKRFNFDEDLVEPITMKDIRFRARRPRDLSLDISKARSMLKTDLYT